MDANFSFKFARWSTKAPVILGGTFECSAYPSDTKSSWSTSVLWSTTRSTCIHIHTHTYIHTYIDVCVYMHAHEEKNLQWGETRGDLRKYFDVTRFPLQLLRCIFTYTYSLVSIHPPEDFVILRIYTALWILPTLAGIYVGSRHWICHSEWPNDSFTASRRDTKIPWKEKERVADAARNESGIGRQSNVSRPRAFSALSPTRAT